MPAKKLFVLANSAKKQNFCVAGREILKQAGGNYHWGGWIRPVSDHDEGALNQLECRLQNSWMGVQPLDVVQLSCLECENCPIQPENWRVDLGKPWVKIDTLKFEDVSELVENPPSLWFQPDLDTDRVTPEHIKLLKKHQSLYLIKPEHFFIRVEENRYSEYRNQKARGCFEYNGVCYELSITDPIFRRKYSIYNQDLGEMEIESGDNCILCISLTTEFNGYHYKVIATVFEPILDPILTNNLDVEIPF